MAHIPEKKPNTPFVPLGIWRHVSKYLAGKDLASATKVSKVFKSTMDSDIVWKNMANVVQNVANVSNVASVQKLSLPKDQNKPMKTQLLEYCQDANKILEREFPKEGEKYKNLDPISRYNAFREYLIKLRFNDTPVLSSLIQKLHAENPREGTSSYILLETLLGVWSDQLALNDAVKNRWPKSLLIKLINHMESNSVSSSDEAIQCACERNDLDLVKFLLNNGVVDVNILALEAAIRHSNVEMFKALLENNKAAIALTYRFQDVMEKAKGKPAFIALLEAYKP